jgi:AraC-like DNA-binding protein
MIKFGPWSTTLGLAMAFGLLVAVLLAASRRNTVANRFLAGVLVVLSLKLAPYCLGYAGFYDAYPWLTFAPLSFGLALGPLLYLHIATLSAGALPGRWAWHLVPGGLQFLYYLALFVQPLAVRHAWSDAWDGPWLQPLETALELGSLLAYLIAALRIFRGYQRWLDAHLSNREELRLPWLRNVLVAMLAATVPWTAYEVASFALSMDYFDRFPLYLGIAGLLVYLGLEGWRHADRRYPVAGSCDPPVAAGPPFEPTAAAPRRDWTAQGEAWLARTESAQWWRDPELSLEDLARRLGTNTRYLSRALNEGLGVSFNVAINRFRVTEVAALLRQPGTEGDLLAHALAAGFSSKTSFNRVFRAMTGMTPSAYRAAHREGRANA